MKSFGTPFFVEKIKNLVSNQNDVPKNLLINTFYKRYQKIGNSNFSKKQFKNIFFSKKRKYCILFWNLINRFYPPLTRKSARDRCAARIYTNLIFTGAFGTSRILIKPTNHHFRLLWLRRGHVSSLKKCLKAACGF